MPRSYENNFDGLRLLFAVFVIITHAYLLTGTDDKFELLSQLTRHQLTFADVGLAGFFSISGFLIFQSLQRSETLGNYFKNRILRIYPGFIVALFITVMVSWLVSDLSFVQFFNDPSPWQYLILKLVLFGSNPHAIQHVFIHNPFPHNVNGSLWTIPYEFFFYILLSVLFFIRKKEKAVKNVVIVLFVISIFFAKAFGSIFPANYYVILLSPFKSICNPLSFIRFGMYFMTGVLLSVFSKEANRYNNILACSSFILLTIFIYLNHLELPKLILLPVLFISLGTMRTKGICGLSAKIGDLSYGIYIYSFLIQQVLMHYFVLNPVQLIVVTLPISFLCGFLSWHLIEKRALMLKHKRKESRTSVPAFAPLPKLIVYNP